MGLGPVLPATPTRLASVSVTVALARALPVKVPRVMVMAAPARIVPTKFVSVMVAAWATHQYTLHICPPPAMTTEEKKLVPVRAPFALAPILKIQIPFAGPLSVNWPVNVAAAAKL